MVTRAHYTAGTTVTVTMKIAVTEAHEASLGQVWNVALRSTVTEPGNLLVAGTGQADQAPVIQKDQTEISDSPPTLMIDGNSLTPVSLAYLT